jgi:hypothetical protein
MYLTGKLKENMFIVYYCILLIPIDYKKLTFFHISYVGNANGRNSIDNFMFDNRHRRTHLCIR